jgi:hypothetical protein
MGVGCVGTAAIEFPPYCASAGWLSNSVSADRYLSVFVLLIADTKGAHLSKMGIDSIRIGHSCVIHQSPVKFLHLVYFNWLTILRHGPEMPRRETVR